MNSNAKYAALAIVSLLASPLLAQHDDASPALNADKADRKS